MLSHQPEASRREAINTPLMLSEQPEVPIREGIATPLMLSSASMKEAIT